MIYFDSINVIRILVWWLVQLSFETQNLCEYIFYLTTKNLDVQRKQGYWIVSVDLGQVTFDRTYQILLCRHFAYFLYLSSSCCFCFEVSIGTTLRKYEGIKLVLSAKKICWGKEKFVSNYNLLLTIAIFVRMEQLLRRFI